MRIINHSISIFFNVNVKDERSNPPVESSLSPFFKVLEEQADNFLVISSYLFNKDAYGRISNLKVLKFNHTGITRDWIRYPQSKNSHITRLFKAIVCLIPAIILKGFVWICNSSKIKARNKPIIEFLKQEIEKQKQLADKDAQSRGFSNKFLSLPSFSITFKTQPKPQSGPLHLLPLELYKSILAFLDCRSLANLSKTSKKDYIEIKTYLSDPLNQWVFYPDLIVKALGIEEIKALPSLKLPNNWQAKWIASGIQDQEIRKGMFERYAYSCYTLDNATSSLFLSYAQSFFMNKSIQKLENKRGLIMQLKNNMEQNTHLFMIANFQGKWVVLSSGNVSQLTLFLQDIRFGHEVPKLQDYLQRLFKGEPCGAFPFDLNNKIKITYAQGQKASDLLNEGPRFCKDGVTPVIQLWATENS